MSSPIEPAGSQGAYGFRLGLGGQFTPYSTTHELNGGLHLQKNQQNNEVGFIPKIYWSKGLNIPVNFGLEWGKTQSDAELWSGYIQWTAFEKIKWPAIALRAGLNKLTGYAERELTSSQVGGIISYGFLKFFDLFYSYQASHNTGRMHSIGEDITNYEWVEVSQTEGIEITIYPPFLRAAFEHTSSVNGFDTYRSKIAYLF